MNLNQSHTIDFSIWFIINVQSKTKQLPQQLPSWDLPLMRCPSFLLFSLASTRGRPVLCLGHCLPCTLTWLCPALMSRRPTEPADIELRFAFGANGTPTWDLTKAVAPAARGLAAEVAGRSRTCCNLTFAQGSDLLLPDPQCPAPAIFFIGQAIGSFEQVRTG